MDFLFVWTLEQLMVLSDDDYRMVLQTRLEVSGMLQFLVVTTSKFE
jgi:hypothetical protein